MIAPPRLTLWGCSYYLCSIEHTDDVPLSLSVSANSERGYQSSHQVAFPCVQLSAGAMALCVQSAPTYGTP